MWRQRFKTFVFMSTTVTAPARVKRSTVEKNCPSGISSSFPACQPDTVWATPSNSFKLTHHRIVQEATTPLGGLNWTGRAHPRESIQRGMCSRPELEEATRIRGSPRLLYRPCQRRPDTVNRFILRNSSRHGPFLTEAVVFT